MKKLLFITLLFIGFSNVITAQKITLTKEEVTAKLCREWKTGFAMMGPTRVEPKEGNGIDITFKADNTYKVSNSKGFSKWRYDAKKKCIELATDGKVHSKITSLDDKEFVMVFVGKTDGPKDLPNIETDFVPKG